MSKQAWVGAVCAVVAVAALLALPLAAQEKAMEKPAKGDEVCSACCVGKCKMMQEKAETMAKMKALLEEAKAAAEKDGSKVAVAKLTEALNLIEEKHKAMHEKLTAHIKAVKDKAAAETDAAKKAELEKKVKEMEDMKCPLCKKVDGAAPKAEPKAEK